MNNQTTTPAYLNRPVDAPLPDYCECHKETSGKTVPAVVVATVAVEGGKSARIALCLPCTILMAECLREAGHLTNVVVD